VPAMMDVVENTKQ